VKSLKEQLEAKNHLEAIKYVESLCEACTEIDENIVLSIHQLLFRDIFDDAGRYRTSAARITGAFFMPPKANDIKPETLKLLEWLRCDFSKRDPIELAALFHHRFVCIHPFRDGNGRVARLLMNYILMRNGYPFIADVKFSDRKKYLDTLHVADIGDNKPLLNYIARVVEQAIDKNIHSFEKPEMLSLAEASKRCPYSQEYLSLLARKGSIGAFKQGRNWYITQEDLDRYVRSIEEKRRKARDQ